MVLLVTLIIKLLVSCNYHSSYIGILFNCRVLEALISLNGSKLTQCHRIEPTFKIQRNQDILIRLKQHYAEY